MEHLRHVSSKQVLLVTYTFKLATNINPIQDAGGQKIPLTRFPPVTSTNVGITLKNFMTFSFNPFATLVQNLKFANCIKL